MISRFSQYLVEEEKVVYFTFGRMNPPTIGHGKLLDKLAKTAGGKSPFRVYLSQSQDSKSNPLSYIDKVKIARKMFPRYGRNIMLNKKVKENELIAKVRNSLNESVLKIRTKRNQNDKKQQKLIEIEEN